MNNMNIDLKNLTIEKAHEAMKTGEYSCRDLAQAYLDEIAKKNAELNVYVEVYDDVLLQADRAQKMFDDGTATLLTGIPIGVKDNILIQGKKVSAGSKMLENYSASYNATVIEELKKEGAVFLGRTNMDEFAMGSSTEYSAYGPTKNPLDPTRVPGGTSGGSAAAVAANMALVALGTETCGSVREPAAFCGVVGLKPTYGGVSRHGVIAMGNSLDQVSPIAKNARDTEILLNAILKYDKFDATSVSDALRKVNPKNGKRLGVPWHLFEQQLDAEIMHNFKESLEKLKNAGYEIVDIELPNAKYSLAVYYIVMPAEVSTNLSRFDGIRYGHHEDGKDLMEVYKQSRAKGFGAEARRRILLGTYVLSHGYYDAYYNRAIKIRQKIKDEMNDAFQKVDFILNPTVPFLPFKLGEKLADPVAMYLCDLFNAPANLTGAPSVAVPSGFNKDGLPFSLQFTSPYFTENTLIEVSKKFETLL